MAPSFSAVEYSTEGDIHSKFNGPQYISFDKVLIELRGEDHVIQVVFKASRYALKANHRNGGWVYTKWIP